ncbi:SEL1-like repeat protein [Thalassobius sp. S69A]|uniref:SEL1-like repeat protein n=1 Tax=unclassified Thalassovita TaxID=2619711 RepID=UPI000C0DE1CB|nr:hypothetical protein [Paracoccaceae bacterium]MBT24863.1 hypothetical protein [Paracoccaceae bacterium]
MNLSRILLVLCLALPLCAQAQAANDAESMYQKGLQYQTGEGVLQNYAQAAEWYAKAADQGHPAAQNRLAQHLFEGLGTAQDTQAALTWFARAAESGDAGYQFDYATALQTMGMETQAAQVYLLAADQGHLEAQTSLGVLYQNGQGVPQDLERARALYEGPADAGLARAQNNLGLLYVRGDGVEQDYEHAAQLFQLAAEQGLHTAMTNLGVMYENGFGVERDETRAHELYRMGGRKETGEQIALPLYDPRLAPPVMTPEAQEILQRSAQARDPIAQFQLAWLLLQPRTVPFEDQRLAARLMEEAAKSGLSSAMANLGWMYFSGLGVPQDYVLGHMWLVLASASGDAQIQAVNAQLSRNLLPSQIDEAQEKAMAYLQAKH